MWIPELNSRAASLADPAAPPPPYYTNPANTAPYGPVVPTSPSVPAALVGPVAPIAPAAPAIPPASVNSIAATLAAAIAAALTNALPSSSTTIRPPQLPAIPTSPIPGTILAPLPPNDDSPLNMSESTTLKNFLLWAIFLSMPLGMLGMMIFDGHRKYTLHRIRRRRLAEAADYGNNAVAAPSPMNDKAAPSGSHAAEHGNQVDPEKGLYLSGMTGNRRGAVVGVGEVKGKGKGKQVVGGSYKTTPSSGTASADFATFSSSGTTAAVGASRAGSGSGRGSFF
ncbi:hypothetical protein QBC34DRAFT_384127 [Podospora aff. communis PSN243]|uniref:Uncharacterized protein n=1 Tax=Podospora aff. communis PSN243 TaxID=3040156 RepID=A0AAV9GAU3_9PEZI|nr:hypothetical protein QBC34DRAFT_384127 [Podospora aff. communis PSN243]